MRTFTGQLINSPIGRRLTLSIVIFSSIITLLTTGIQLINDYLGDVNRIEEQFVSIEKVNLEVLSASLWVLDEELINTQLHGLIQLPDISYIVITDDTDQTWSLGRYSEDQTIDKLMPLRYGEIELGRLEIQANLRGVYSRLLNRAIIILLSNGVKTFIVAGFILFLVWYRVTRHLHTLSQYSQEIDLDTESAPLDFYLSDKIVDEFTQVASAINTMQQQLRSSFNDIKQSKEALQLALQDRDRLLELERSYKDKLAQQVRERTHELELSLTRLKRAQHVLVEQEKMAALGSLVSGVAHEINTPIGICLTAASSQLSHIEALSRLLHSDSATLEEINTLLDDYQQSCELIINNITRASNLIQKFKSVAAEQNSQQRMSINLKQSLEEDIESVMLIFHEQQVEMEIDVPPELFITTNVQLLSQIMTNIVSNAFSHGTPEFEPLRIRVSVIREPERIKISIQDNGAGVDSEIAPHIFEPFYTTTRSKGGTGLGLAAAFNAVTLLKGNIEYQSVSELGGACFVISLPLP